KLHFTTMPSRGEAIKKQRETCSVKSCDNPSVEVGLVGNNKVLCQEHLDNESETVRKQAADVSWKMRQLVPVAKQRAKMTKELQALTIEVQEVNEMFNAVQEKLQQWRQKTVNRLQLVHQSVAERLTDADEAETREKEASLALAAQEIKKLAELSKKNSAWLVDASKRCKDFNNKRYELREFQRDYIDAGPRAEMRLRSFGDVAAGVQQFQSTIDDHMTSVMTDCWLDLDNNGDDIDDLDITPVSSNQVFQVNLQSEPKFLAACSNTAGFVVNSVGFVKRSADCTGRGNVRPLGAPCVFFERQTDEKQSILAFSAELKKVLNVECDFSSTSGKITGLHCDSNRQQLFVTHRSTVTVTDLSGGLVKVISGSSFDGVSRSFDAIAGNSDKLCFLDLAKQCVFSIDKDSSELLSVIDLWPLHDKGIFFTDLALVGSKLLLFNWGVLESVLKICGITGQAISSLPDKDSDDDEEPVDAAARVRRLAIDSKGFIVKLTGNEIVISTGNDVFVDSFELPVKETGLCGHIERLELVEKDNARWLAFTSNRNRLVLLKLAYN
ncbi:hypothetical protein BOX15_Mlig019012g3, partial [Macrostomum lignano]